MNQPGNKFISYKHLAASNPQDLEKKMLAVAFKSDIPVNFTAPSYAQGKWNVWYLYDFSKDLRPKDKLKLNNQRLPNGPSKEDIKEQLKSIEKEVLS